MKQKEDKQNRSRIMASVKSSGNRSTEARFRNILSVAGISGWREQARDLTGKPDFVFDQERIAIFIDGCFWHGCPICYRRPQSSQEYWDQKVQSNIKRDRKIRSALRRQGWSVLRFWEHDLKNPEKVMRRVLLSLDRRSKEWHKPNINP
ncbi:very short patch repair endonuclease [Chloroflexus sp.]|uniref:very short patch repair endonuclease n=1 Tax=Chloroflexus sp. TaxID=1904827 RepID=UPI00298F1A84|nr:very short patch repair endonuclease [Chloroflexus sp.]MDW8405516.1 very short patch repair endonuclease [Chloroflexus sp.]